MRLLFLFTPRVRRCLFALVTGVLTVLAAIDLMPHAFADTKACSRHDVAAWQLSMAETDPFKQTAVLLKETEAFLETCPQRPETHFAKSVAGILATRLGDAEQAVTYFEAGAPLHALHAKFAHITALLALRQSDAAWVLRDAMVKDWLHELKRSKHAEVKTRRAAGGAIHEVIFARPDTETGISVLWLAVPSGPGWPAALSAGARRQVTPVRLIANTQPDTRLQQIDYYRCRTRRMLGRGRASQDLKSAQRLASNVLRGYLTNPDQYQSSAPSAPLSGCFWPERLMPHAR